MMVETNNGKHAVLIEPAHRAHGWVHYRHPDGQWVTLRKADERELAEAEAVSRVLAWLASPGPSADPKEILLYSTSGEFVRSAVIHCAGELPRLVEDDDPEEGPIHYVRTEGARYQRELSYMLGLGETNASRAARTSRRDG